MFKKAFVTAALLTAVVAAPMTIAATQADAKTVKKVVIHHRHHCIVRVTKVRAWGKHHHHSHWVRSTKRICR